VEITFSEAPKITRSMRTARLCLSLARSSAGRQVMEKHPADENVKRTAAALGR